MAEPSFVSSSQGFALGANGATVYHTGDGGATWSASTTNLPQGSSRVISQVDFVSAATGFAIESLPDGTFTRLLVSSDGGKTWSAVLNSQ